MWGGLLGNKRPDRGKKFQGARNFRGGLFGEMPKKGWKNFLGEVGGVQKVVGIFFLGHNNFLGENFGGDCWEIKKMGMVLMENLGKKKI